MAEAQTNTVDNIREPNTEDVDSRLALNSANLRKHGAMYGLAVIASLTLFGAAHTWASATGWVLATGTAIAAAIAAGMVLSSIFHEWGHYSGAALSGSTIKIADKPSDYYFFLGFNPKANSVKQALWMTWGGLIGSWSLALLVLLLVPMDSWMSAALLATAVGRAINASVFEVPIALRTIGGDDFKTALKERQAAPGVVQFPGLIAGLILAAVVA